jgi:hypothetical protein
MFVADAGAPRLLTPWPPGAPPSARRADRPAAESGLATSGPVPMARMVLAGTARAGDMAVLRYVLRGQSAG